MCTLVRVWMYTCMHACITSIQLVFRSQFTWHIFWPQSNSSRIGSGLCLVRIGPVGLDWFGVVLVGPDYSGLVRVGSIYFVSPCWSVVNPCWSGVVRVGSRWCGWSGFTPSIPEGRRLVRVHPVDPMAEGRRSVVGRYILLRQLSLVRKDTDSDSWRMTVLCLTDSPLASSTITLVTWR